VRGDMPPPRMAPRGPFCIPFKTSSKPIAASSFVPGVERRARALRCGRAVPQQGASHERLVRFREAVRRKILSEPPPKIGPWFVAGVWKFLAEGMLAALTDPTAVGITTKHIIDALGLIYKHR
jgi:hypothetical protein